MNKGKIELAIHIIFWILYFTSVNVAWASDWFDTSLRSNTPAPLLILIFPIYFYVNAFILIPKYFSISQWNKYLLYATLLFIVPELIRCGIYIFRDGSLNFTNEIFSRDSLLFGAPSPFFIAINTSFIYRFAKDWFANKNKIKQLESENSAAKPSTPYENTELLSAEEVKVLTQKLKIQLSEKEVFLNPALSLRELAGLMETTEKKLSYLLNQSQKSSFYELLNFHRVEKFKSVVQRRENENLSTVGIALNCGFQSKSSFYRAFKANVGVSPSEYIKTLNKPHI